ncbi:Sugar phosphate isomerase/epimerase [Pseudoxanthobacter soli DSM 19599]|uniref:Sugar phosphate isomerase/epimerase n=1 Tax=Pseudoxanthobacter soli DSM 19599 TaxID=1123029 RepID=A0A1M7ZKW3_9HYPH|nr:sugar phosphate isomerase/epimerase family protein [Pseudoxanthobacter soli]SHO65452.1 Sugar phosphate isomerase/epimerase [Pseudoxanthobacter soli DSM 19599]
MRTLKGPGVFLAQFAADEAPFNTLDGLAGWAAAKGFKGVQLPTWDRRVIDIERAAASQDYVDEIVGTVAAHGLVVTELASHLQGQLVALHPSFDLPADSFAPPELRGNPAARQQWAVEQLRACAVASRRFGIDRHVTFSGTLLWPYLYPYPQWPDGLIDDGFDELARRWRPLLDAFDAEGVDLCYEIHPTEDLHDGLTFEMFLERVDNHPRCNIMYDPSHLVLQSIDYLGYIDAYHERIRMFHVKDAEFRPTAKTGAYGGYQPWLRRAGRFRSPGDGQVDFGAIFAKLAGYDFDGWAVLEWECCLKNPEDGAAEGAKFIADHIIRVSERAFDDFVKSGADRALNRRILGY